MFSLLARSVLLQSVGAGTTLRMYVRSDKAPTRQDPGNYGIA